MKNNFPKETAVIVLFVLIVAGLLGCILWPRQETIEVQARWWISYTYVQYTTTQIETESYTTYDCTGYGENRSCTTNYHTRPVIKTETHTRCKADLTETELPVQYPDPPCTMYSGDYLTYSEALMIRYRTLKDDKVHDQAILDHLWDHLYPGKFAKIKKNLFVVYGIVTPKEEK